MAEFKGTTMKSRLPSAQHRRIRSLVLTGNIGAGQWKTVKALIDRGFIERGGGRLRATRAAVEYIDRCEREDINAMPVPPRRPAEH